MFMTQRVNEETGMVSYYGPFETFDEAESFSSSYDTGWNAIIQLHHPDKMYEHVYGMTKEEVLASS